MDPEEVQKQLQSKIDEFIKSGCVLSILDRAAKKFIYSTLLDSIKLVNVYSTAEDRLEFDIGWQPAYFEPRETEGKSDYIVDSPFYHHIVKITISDDSVVFVDFWPDGTSRELKIEKIKDPLDDKKFKAWKDFKSSHPEKVSHIDEILLEIPWGRLIDHKGCPEQ